MQPVEHRALAPQHLALRPIVSNGLPVEIAQFFLGGHPPFAPLSSDSVWTYIHPAFPEGAEETGVYPVVVKPGASPLRHRLRRRHLSQRERQVDCSGEEAPFKFAPILLAPPVGPPAAALALKAPLYGASRLGELSAAG